jgi:hypothetical protein
MIGSVHVSLASFKCCAKLCPCLHSNGFKRKEPKAQIEMYELHTQYWEYSSTEELHSLFSKQLFSVVLQR